MINFEPLKSVFNEDSDEYKTIVEAYNIMSKSAPVTSGESKTQMLLLDNLRIKLSTYYYLCCKKISDLKKTTQSAYDTQYARLVKLGRPSNASIECEIRLNSPEYAKSYSQMTDLEDVKTLLSSYLKCLDNSKITAIEILRDSRRID